MRLNQRPLAGNHVLLTEIPKASYYVLTALDAAGNESAWSTEVAVIPTP